MQYLLILLIAFLLNGAVAQNRQTAQSSASASARASASATTTVSGSSIQELQTSLEEQAQQAFADLTSNPDDLNTVIATLAQQLSQAIAQIMITFLESGDISVEEQAALISSAVSAAMSAAANAAGGDLANLNVTAIATSIESSVATILGSVDADVDLAALTQQVAESVVSIVGNAVAEAIGGSFTASVEVSTITTPAAITLDAGPSSSVDISALIAAGDVQDILVAMELALSAGNIEQVADDIVASLPDALQTLNATFSLIWLNETYQVWPLTTALGAAYKKDQRNIVTLLGQSIIAVNTQDTAAGLARALSYAFATGGDAQNAFDAALSWAIKSGGCSAVADVLSEAQLESQKEGVGMTYFNAVQNNPEIAECTRQGKQLQISVDILALLDKPQEAALEIAQNIQEGNVGAISTLITSAISEGRTEDLVSSLSLLMNNTSINITTLTLAFTIAVQQGGSDVEQALSQVVTKASIDGNTALLIPTIQFAFSTAPQNVTELFINIITRGVQGQDCGNVKDIVSDALKTAEGSQEEQILQTILDNPDLTPCVDLSLLPVPPASPTLDTQATDDVFRFDSRGSRVMIGQCYDITPPGGLTCEQQATYGKCDRSWMLKGGFCSVTCGFCENECIEIQPSKAKTCAMEQREANCDNIIQEGFCRRTCGKRCEFDMSIEISPIEDTVITEAAAQITGDSVDSTAQAASLETDTEVCDDQVPDDQYTCAEQKEFGKCQTSWMIAGNFCKRTCGRCADGAQVVTGDDKEKCECGCGCCAEQNAEVMGKAIAEAVKQVLQELNN